MSSFDVTDPCVSQPKKHKGGDERAEANTKKAMLEGMASKDAKEAAAFAESMAAVDRLIEGQLQGAKPAKLRIDKRRACDSLQLQFSDPDLVLTNPTSLTINGCAETLEGLQTRLYTTEEQKKWLLLLAHQVQIKKMKEVLLKAKAKVIKGNKPTVSKK